MIEINEIDLKFFGFCGGPVLPRRVSGVLQSSGILSTQKSGSLSRLQSLSIWSSN
jgi:hypothetical protein